MRQVGVPSWSFTSTGGGSTLDWALLVRDLCGLPVPERADLPGRVVEADPRLPRMLSQQERADASEQWVRWWRALVDLAVRANGGYSTPRQVAWREQLDLPFEDVGSGPRWQGLDDRPALYKSVLIARPVAQAVMQDRQRKGQVLLPDGHYELAKSLAEAVIAEQQVSPDLVRALVLELQEPGVWWAPWSPGVVVASAAAMRDEAAARRSLQTAYWTVV
jgi:hypothetical protein